jgi:hypothetical protein
VFLQLNSFIKIPSQDVVVATLARQCLNQLSLYLELRIFWQHYDTIEGIIFLAAKFLLA